MDKSIPIKWIQVAAGVTIQTYDKIDFKLKLIWRNKEGHFILIKGTVNQEDISIFSIHVPNSSAPNLLKKKFLLDLRKQINSNLLMVGDLKIPHIDGHLDQI